MERENVEELLCVAAITGDLVLLHQIIAKDKYILDKVSVGSFKGKNPLHVAISRGKKEFVGELLVIEPGLAEILDAELGSALHTASAKGNLEIVKVLVAVKPEMCLARDRDGNNPLHIASARGDLEIVKALVAVQPEMCLVRDQDGNNPLHIASARGDLEIVKALVMVSPQMCLALDRDGNNPLHIAAMKGKVDVLEELIRTGSQRAKVKVDRGETTLHLCVKYDQFQCLKLLLDKIPDSDFVNDVDADGNTILHLAFFDKRWEMIKYVLDKNNCKIHVNAANKSGRTALDIHLLVGNPTDSVHKEIIQILLRAGAKPGTLAELSWQTKSRDALMIVASLIATVAFQTGVNPPGGVWQDDSAGHQAGKAILAYKYPNSYLRFIAVNTSGFLSSLALIFLFVAFMRGPSRFDRLARPLVAWIILIPTAFAYAYSVTATFPEDMHTSNKLLLQIPDIKVLVIVWAVIITLVLLYTWFPLFLEIILERGDGTRSFLKEVGGNQSNLELVIHQPPQAAALISSREAGTVEIGGTCQPLVQNKITFALQKQL